MQQRDVYTEVQKAFDHNFNLFRVDLTELVFYSAEKVYQHLVLFFSQNKESVPFYRTIGIN